MPTLIRHPLVLSLDSSRHLARHHFILLRHTFLGWGFGFAAAHTTKRNTRGRLAWLVPAAAVGHLDDANLFGDDSEQVDVGEHPCGGGRHGVGAANAVPSCRASEQVADLPCL